jgi:hypothetical protein
MRQRMSAKAVRAAASQADESVEMALLAEFMSHDTVGSLAAEIARRLGAKARAQDLIARAGLGPTETSTVSATGHSSV